MSTLHKPWTNAEIKFLTTNATKFKAEYIGWELGRTANAVRTKAAHIGISLSKSPRWTDEELEFLRANAGEMTGREIGVVLGRDPQSVLNKACRLGIPFGTRQRYSDAQILEVLKLHQQGLPYAAIECSTGISAAVFKEYIGGRRRKAITARKG